MEEIEEFSEGSYFHIYNRGINKENIFRSEEDYYIFLTKYTEYTKDVLETFAFSFLKNHFHFLVYVKKEVYVELFNKSKRLNATKQLSHFMNGYAQKINSKYNGTGGLFQSRFKRKSIDDTESLKNLVYYINANACRHKLVDDFRDWPFSSYHDLISEADTFLQRAAVHDWFGGKENFIDYHLGKTSLITPGKWMLED